MNTAADADAGVHRGTVYTHARHFAAGSSAHFDTLLRVETAKSAIADLFRRFLSDSRRLG
jgi:hypothetical protein